MGNYLELVSWLTPPKRDPQNPVGKFLSTIIEGGPMKVSRQGACYVCLLRKQAAMIIANIRFLSDFLGMIIYQMVSDKTTAIRDRLLTSLTD